MLRLAILAALAAITAAMAPSGAQAWDGEADRAVAILAYQRLSPQARSRVDQILAASGPVGDTGCRARTLADAPDFAACLHGHREDFMRGVVYDPIPLCPSPRPPCADGHCASDALKREIAALKAPDTRPADRAVALEAVAYLVPELHQPLHAADNGDHGGQRFRVTLPGAPNGRMDLNGLWDQDLVASAIGDAETGLAYLAPLAQMHAADWSQGDVDAWVADTHKVALDDVYGRLPAPPDCNVIPDKPERIDTGYVAFGAQVVRTQLAKAAVRLAAVLNATLG